MRHRQRAFVVVAALVVAVHAWVLDELRHLLVFSADSGQRSLMRMEVDFIQELAPSEPAQPPISPARVLSPTTAVAASPAASAPLVSPPESAASSAHLRVADLSEESAPSSALAAEEPAPATPVGAALSASEAASASGSGSGFEWPPSTRLSYTLKGYYRGPVEGSAQVQWLKQDKRYQVHLDVLIGPDFAPLMTRKMTSDGWVTPSAGLEPQRYEEETRVAMFRPRKKVIVFQPQQVILSDGPSAATLPGIQDTASQFVQLTWLFTTQPQRLQVGQSLEVPLALPRRVDRWAYDIVSQEVISTPVGDVPAYYVKPRRMTPQPGELVIEAWFAPSLQYLPVRLRIRQDDQAWADLLLSRLPQQATR